MPMQYLAGEKQPSAERITAILNAGGVEADSERLQKLLQEVKGKKIDDVECCFL